MQDEHSIPLLLVIGKEGRERKGKMAVGFKKGKNGYFGVLGGLGDI